MTPLLPYFFWSISIAFVLFQFFLQLSSGVVVDAITKDLSLTASCAGFLSSAYYYVYTALQIPVGILFDRKNTRALLTYTAFFCSVSCVLFAHSQTFTQLMLSRLLMGGSSAFAFIGVSHILRTFFSDKQFPFMIGLSETLAFLATVIFMFGMGVSTHPFDWRQVILDAGMIGFVITGFCFLLPNRLPHPAHHIDPWQALLVLCRNKIAWINGIFVGVGFGFITIFAAMWAVPFIQLKANCSLQTASILDAMIFLGAGLSCPLFGILDTKTTHRSTLLLMSYVLTAGLFLVLLFAPITHLYALAALLCAMGMSCGSYMLTYTISNEISNPQTRSTSTGFTNTLAVITAPILQPVVGYLLDWHKIGAQYTLADYQFALTLIPLSLLFAAGLALWLPAKASLREV